MPQTIPSYGHMTSSVSKLITEPLINKYGSLSVVCPIVIIKNGEIAFYIYEATKFSMVNQINSNRPKSAAKIVNYFNDYTVTPRIIFPPVEFLKEFISPPFSCNYEFILQQDQYNSVDIDYVWFNGTIWKGIELTTLYVPLKDKAEAERLVKMFVRRPSWQGINGPRAIYKLIDAAGDLGIEYYFVLVNSDKGVSNSFVTSGNSYWFPLTRENIGIIFHGSAPLNGQFGTFVEMLNWL